MNHLHSKWRPYLSSKLAYWLHGGPGRVGKDIGQITFCIPVTTLVELEGSCACLVSRSFGAGSRVQRVISSLFADFENCSGFVINFRALNSVRIPASFVSLWDGEYSSVGENVSESVSYEHLSLLFSSSRSVLQGAFCSIFMADVVSDWVLDNTTWPRRLLTCIWAI